MSAKDHFFDLNLGSDKPLLVLSHANGFPPQTYISTLAPLLLDFHVVSLIARPFWGNTPHTWLKHWSQLADDLIEGLEGQGNCPVIGVGHSLGGVQMLYAAVRRPELFSRLILIDPTMLAPKLLWQVRFLRLFGFDARASLIQGALRRRTQWPGTQEALDYFKGRPLFKNWPDRTVCAYAENITGPAPEGGVRLTYPPEWEAQIYRTIPTDVWKAARALKIPALVIRGENSNTFTVDSEEAFRRAQPKIHFEVVPGAGHLVAQERPTETGKLIQDWLKSPLTTDKLT